MKENQALRNLPRNLSRAGQVTAAKALLASCDYWLAYWYLRS
jgi:hypothetical protein